MKNQYSLTYQKSNIVISSFMSISIKGYRMMSYINYKAQQLEKEGNLSGFIKLYTNEMAMLLGLPNNGDKYKLADAAAKELRKAVMYSYDRKTGDIKSIVIFPDITFRNEEHCIEINTQILSFTQLMCRQKKGNFTICALEDAKKFRSVYSARIADYIRMESFEKNRIGENEYEIEVDLIELKLMSGTIVLDSSNGFAKISEIMDNISSGAVVENKFAEWKRFKEKILDKAIRDINDKTDMQVDYRTKRTGRGGKTSSVIFHVIKQPTNMLTEESEGVSVERRESAADKDLAELCEQVKKIVPFDIDLKTCTDLLTDADQNVKKIEMAVSVLEENPNVKNQIGFLRKAIQENWQNIKSKKKISGWNQNNLASHYHNQEDYDQLEEMLLKKAFEK